MFNLIIIFISLGLMAYILSAILKAGESSPNPSNTKQTEQTDGPEIVNPKTELVPPQDILFLASCLNGFASNNISFTVSDKSFYLDFAPDKKDKLNSDIPFTPDFYFEEGLTLDDLAQKINIPDLPNLIEKHRRAVSWNINKSEIAFLNNGHQYGVYNIIVTRNDDFSVDHLEIVLYNTDAFTDLVMKSIFSELQSRKHQICWAIESNVTLYNLFLTSLDTKMVIIDNYLSNAKKLVVANEENSIKPCFSKYLTNKDLSQEGLLSPSKWLINILKEMGIRTKTFETPEARLYDLYFDRSKFSIGFCSALIFPESYRSLNDALQKSYISNLSFVGINLIANELYDVMEKSTLSLAELFSLENIAEQFGVGLHRYSSNYDGYKNLFGGDDAETATEKVNVSEIASEIS